MSYDIIYDRKFIDVGDGTFIPFALYGCNNVTESCIDSRGRHYEKRVRGWRSMVYSCFGDRTRLSFTKEEMVSSLKKMFEEGKYCSSTKFNGKFFTQTSEINFFENGCKNASPIEDIVGRCWGISIDVKAYSKGSYDSRDVFSSSPRTTEELKLALEQARMAAKVNSVGDTVCYVSMKSYSSEPLPKLGAPKRRRSSVVNAEIKKNTHYVIKLENGRFFAKRSSVRYWHSGWASEAKAFRTQKEAERYLSKAPFSGTVVEIKV